MFNIKVCCITLYREEAWGGAQSHLGEGAVSPGGDASPRLLKKNQM